MKPEAFRSHGRCSAIFRVLLPSLFAAAFAGMAAAQESADAIAEKVAADDAAFEDFGKRVLKALESGDRAVFAETVLISPKDMAEVFSKFPEEARERTPEDRRPGSEAFQKIMEAQVENAAETFSETLAFAKEHDVELTAPLALAGVEHEDIQMRGEFPTSDIITVKFLPAGAALDSEPFAVALRECGKIDRGWVCHGGIGWRDIPDTLLDEDAKGALAVQRARASGKPLPSGLPAPDIEFIRLSDGEKESLSDFRGKVVVVDFWASWCGPCQEPMAKMQTYAEKHPEWGDKVALIALSIDNTKDAAADHLAAKGWDKTHNAWAGDGGFASKPPTAYAVRGIPTAYVIDQDGKIHASGHPGSMDIPEIVSGLLKEE